MLLILIIIATLIGCLMPVQAAINAELTRFIKFPFLAAFISFFIGTLTLLLIMIFQRVPMDEIKKLTTASPHLFLGGMLGALFVGSSIFFVPRIGATTMIAAFVTGQLLMSVIIDHFGLFGIPVLEVNLSRLIGVFLLFVGLFLVVKKAA